MRRLRSDDEGRDTKRGNGCPIPAAPPPSNESEKARIERINRRYDHHIFPIREKSTNDFANYGYWTPETRTYGEACENLMEKLMAFIPEKNGRILDVACGKGATTRYLLKYYTPENITGIMHVSAHERH